MHGYKTSGEVEVECVESVQASPVDKLSISPLLFLLNYVRVDSWTGTAPPTLLLFLPLCSSPCFHSLTHSLPHQPAFSSLSCPLTPSLLSSLLHSLKLLPTHPPSAILSLSTCLSVCPSLSLTSDTLSPFFIQFSFPYSVSSLSLLLPSISILL